MKVGAASAQAGALEELLDDIIPAAQEPLEGEIPNLGFLFASVDFAAEMEQAAESIQERTGVETLLGCTAEGIVGPSSEIEHEPAAVLWLAYLPDARIQGFHIDRQNIERAIRNGNWRPHLGTEHEPGSALIALADPFSTNITAVMASLDQHFPGSPVLGGMTSGVMGPGESVLIHNGTVHHDGMVGVSLSEGPHVRAIISQGCRPVGQPQVVTQSEKNVIQQLGGKPPLSVVREIYESADADTQDLMQDGLFVGRAITEYQDTYTSGDFIIRNIMGADESSGAISITDTVPAGITIQFQVRDAGTADEELRELLGSQTAHNPAAALVFTCNGRGTRMFPEPDHDISALRETLGDLPAAGFFAAGEFGPVAGKNFAHGFTASIALFIPRDMD